MYGVKAMNYIPQLYIIQEEIQTQEQIEKQEQISLYKNAMYEQARTYASNMENGDHNMACSSTEQLAENGLKLIAIVNNNLTPELEESHDLVGLYELNSDKLDGFSTNDMKRIKKRYYYKYANKKYHADREEAERAGKEVSKIIDVAINEAKIDESELQREIGEYNYEKIHNISDVNFHNRLKNRYENK